MFELKAPMSGQCVSMQQVPDEVFSDEILGKGVAIEPDDGMVYAPCDGVITNVASTYHALCITSENGIEILLHIGIDTVDMKGKGFSCYVKEGKKVKCGDKLMKLDLKACKKAGHNPISPVIIMNHDDYKLTYSHGTCVAKQSTIITLE